MSKPSSKFPAGCLLLGAFFTFIILGMIIPPDGPGHLAKAMESRWMLQSRAIALLMAQYAQDHAGHYPDGKSSTEVFQKLLDEKYTDDPTLFYATYALGKTKPLPDQPLKPENISFDITSEIDATTSTDIPVVFLTGYRVIYAPGSSAEPLIKPDSNPSRTWIDWWHGAPEARIHPETGIAVSYKDTSARWLKARLVANNISTITDFIPTTFDAHGKTYRQLTPTGPLSP